MQTSFSLEAQSFSLSIKRTQINIDKIRLSSLPCEVIYLFCYPALTKCERQRAEYSANPAPGAFTPRCKANGNYEAEQCLGSVCYCVNINGIRIPGTGVNIGQGRPKCKDPG